MSERNPDGWQFCSYCGEKYAFAAQSCISCGAPSKAHSNISNPFQSPKSYGVAVALCGVFGTMGIHHFYLGNIVHGLFDFILFVAAVYFFFAAVSNDDVSLFLLAFSLFIVDAIHTFIVFFMLITGHAKDGRGRVVTIPK